MRGQTNIKSCAWCGEPAEGNVEVQPCFPGTKAKNYRDYKDARILPACGKHMEVQIGRIAKPRRSRKQVETLF